MSDGGCTNPGDVAKAFGAGESGAFSDLSEWKMFTGADFVMLGGLFAGHDQSGGDLIEKVSNCFCELGLCCIRTRS